MNGRVHIVPSSLVGVRAVVAHTNHAFGRHFHDQFGVGVIERGAQTSASGRGRVEAGAGNTITVNAGEVHDGLPINANERTWRMLYLDSELVRRASSDIHAGTEKACEFTEPVVRDEQLFGMVLALFGAITRSTPVASTLRQDELLLGVIAALIGSGPAEVSSRHVPGALLKLRDWMTDDPAAPLTLDDLARESQLSRFQVVRGFKAAFGLTPHAYLVQCRINLAWRLIESGSPLAEAAFASGFADQSHMTRYVGKQFGAPPAALRGSP